jgi:hypothetical protein
MQIAKHFSCCFGSSSNGVFVVVVVVATAVQDHVAMFNLQIKMRPMVAVTENRHQPCADLTM